MKYPPLVPYETVIFVPTCSMDVIFALFGLLLHLAGLQFLIS